ncbi:MAG: lipopolysaccharide biosynthesis protein [Comamonadaceae bacterium BICA1-1]|nr:MAG: lipopolysaccharide biosynthesis protein [Comamonadaceae bacterium BICA1-1]
MNPQASPSQPNGTPDEDEISLLDLFATIAANLKLLIIAPLLVGFAVLGISFLMTPIYTAQTKFLPPMQQQSAAAAMLQQLGGLAGLAGAAGGITDPADQFVAFLGSRSVQDSLVERFALMERYESRNREAAARSLGERTRISSGRDGLITIAFDDPDPAFAAQVANAYVEELGQLVGRLALTEAQHRRKFFEQHLVKVSADLQEAEQALMATGVNVRALNIQPGAALQAVALLRAQVTAQEVQVASMRTHLSEAAPELRQAMATLGALRGQLNRLDAQERATPNTAAGTNPNNPGYFARLREFTLQQTLFELMVKQYEMARVDESREGASIQVLDIAQAPEQRSSPKRALMATIASLATGFALLLFVFVREAVRNAGQDPASAAKMAAIRRSLGLRG